MSSASRSYRPTVAQVFAAAYVGLMVLLFALLSFIFSSSKRSILESSERFRSNASERITESVNQYLKVAEHSIEEFQLEASRGVFDFHSTPDLERALFVALTSSGALSEVAFTYGNAVGYDGEGEIQLAPRGRGKLLLYRQGERVVSHFVRSNGTRFEGSSHEFGEAVATSRKGAPAEDPTRHLTFTTPASAGFAGRTLWSDLHWSELGASSSGEQSAVRVSAQKAIFDAQHRFLGVFRAGLSTDQIDKVSQLKLNPSDPNDPHEVFLCDNAGRLLTRRSKADRIVSLDGDLRVAPAFVPPYLRAALDDPMLKAVDASRPEQSGRIVSDGRDYWVTYRMIPGSQDWIVGIVVPEEYYLGSLLKDRQRLLGVCLAILAAIALGGGLLARQIRLAQGRLADETARMNQFDFRPSVFRTFFSDINHSLEGMESAKRAMRAMSKYVPIDLVRKLYQDRKDPALGGDLMPVSMMFTDIEGFTTISEKLSPDRLAQALGEYLAAMTHVIHETGGVVDKFIGDSVMALWGAPAAIEGDAERACQSALLACERTDRLFASDIWTGFPRFDTRFGIHKESVMVGHFGSLDRMNYTAIGDGVNLASRLEGLNKGYGTRIIVSECIKSEAGSRFFFRKLDLVAVKGKAQPAQVYELVGFADRIGEALRAKVGTYERAFESYRARRFEEAVRILEPQMDDHPSTVLAGRCRHYLAEPPSPDWRGEFEAKDK